IVNNLLDGKDNTSQQKFRGQVEDLSLGGLSLMIRLSKKENARLLLGRRIVSSLPMGTDEVLERKGEIIGVSLQDYIDKNYRVHVRFDQPIGADDLKNLLLQWHK
ncbi:MAG: PilZ domain-containing protein, partial [Proteobacteria bacterium]|nr:PilZ domain-containing protein [Pseudomonadota bacterium]